MESLILQSVVLFGILSFTIADFRDDALNVHNELRAGHGSPPLSLKKELNDYAQNYAEELARENKFEHSGGEYGENIYSISGTGVSSKSDSEIVMDAIRLSWYGEVKKYNYDNPKFSFETGHFTAIVWKNTKYLGIGIARRGKTVYVVASYDPAGNFLGEFGDNVFQPISNTSESNCTPSNFLKWIAKNETVPNGFSPISAGLDFDGKVYHVCTALHSGDLIPGKLVRGNCYVSHGGEEHKYKEVYRYAVFRKLNGCPILSWSTKPSTLNGGVPGGITADGDLLYVSRCPMPICGQQVVVPGWIPANDTSKAFYAFGGQDLTCTNYDILVLSEAKENP